MKLPITAALALAVFTAGACADDTAPGAVLVPNNHGGYNATYPSARNGATQILPFFGTHGFAAHVIAHSRDKPSFLLVPVVEDVGHGNKITVYKKIFFATPEEAEAAKQKPNYGQ